MPTIKFSQRYLLSFLLLLLFSCSKPDGQSDQTNPPVNQPNPIYASLQGKVVDWNNRAIVGVTVKAGNNTTTTDSKGFFFFFNISLDRYATLVTVNPGGIYEAFRTLPVKEGALDFVKIKVPLTQSRGSFFSVNGGTVALPNNSSVSFSANSIVFKSNNQPFIGGAIVEAGYIDPTASDIGEQVPGSFLAVDTLNNALVLKSFGMIRIQLSAQGQPVYTPLQLAANKTAKLRVGIPASLQSNAPSTIPFWVLDAATGLWKKEGQATKVNNAYETDVTHFLAIWNCGVPLESRFIEMSFKDGDGVPISHAKIKITGRQSGYLANEYMDANGYLSAFVPTSEIIDMPVVTRCNETVFIEGIGPITQNVNFGSIVGNLQPQYTMKVTGKLINCSDQPVTKGSAKIYFEDELYVAPATSGGNYSATIIKCSNPSAIGIIAFDSSNNKHSSTYGFTSANNLNTGTLTACDGSAISYIHYKVNNDSYDLSSAAGDTLVASANLSPNGTGFPLIYVISKTQSPTVHMWLEYSGPWGTPGTYGITNFAVNALDSWTPSTPFGITILQFGDIGEFVEGSINAKIFRQGSFYTITGTFRIKRIA